MKGQESLTIIRSLSTAEKIVYQNAELLTFCKETSVGFISRSGVIYTHDLLSPKVFALCEKYKKIEGVSPFVQMVSPEIVEDVLQQPSEVLLMDSGEMAIDFVERTNEMDIDITDEDNINEIEFNELLHLAYTEQLADIHIKVMCSGTMVKGRGPNGLYRLQEVMRNREYGLGIGNQIFSVLASEGSSGQFFESEPDENRFTWKINGKNRNYRSSTMPEKGGCKINIRCLDPYVNDVLRPEQLGFTPSQLSLLMMLFHKPYGGLLITGQTGSGKTTTLMSFLNVLPESLNIHSLEDPVEWLNPKMSQTEINMDGSVDEYNVYRGSFADYGKRLLRQDLDVAMFGELRDELSCSIFYRLASTGHMAVGTLHTGSALSCITMLIEFFKLSPTQVSDMDAFNAFLNQKLANVSCPYCCVGHDEHKKMLVDNLIQAKETAEFNTVWQVTQKLKEIELVESVFEDSPDVMHKLKYAKKGGCRKCKNRGYRGKSVIAEILVLDTTIRDYIKRGDLLGIHGYLDSIGYQTCRDHAIQKISCGIIDIHEACRLINDMDVKTVTTFDYTRIRNDMYRKNLKDDS